MLNDLAKLYQELIIEHSKNPRNKGILETPNSKKGLGVNASCGDKLLLSSELEDGIISSIKHDSDGCSIFMASCSMISQMFVGKTTKEALDLLNKYLRLVTFDEDTPDLTDSEHKELGKLQVFENIRNYPARVKCATLAARTLQSILVNWESDEDIITSTEDDED